jgi:hypothetical protein
MADILKEYKEPLFELFRNSKVQSIYLIGSYAGGKEDDKSDVDFLVEFMDNLDPLERGELWWTLYDKLREILKKDVDLISTKSLKNPYFIESIEKSKKLVYAA